MIDEHEWRALRRLFRSAFESSLCFSIASVDDEGQPYITPIGSLLLGPPGRAFYFEIFAQRLGARLERDSRLAVLAVDSGKRLWLDALCRGRFRRLPSVRLMGRAEAARPARPEEVARWRRRVRPLLPLPGSRRLWSRLDVVRDIAVDRVDVMELGAVTAAVPVWPPPRARWRALQDSNLRPPA